MRARTSQSEIGWGKGIPIVATWAEAAKLEPDALLIGVAPMGGQLSDDLRKVVCDALSSGVSIISGLHTMLRDDRQLARRWCRQVPSYWTFVTRGRSRSSPRDGLGNFLLNEYLRSASIASSAR